MRVMFQRSISQAFRGSVLLIGLSASLALAADLPAGTSMPVWPGLAPGETSHDIGIAQPRRDGEVPPVTRVVKIRKPTIDVFLAENPNGSAVVVLPGGGFMKVVPDKRVRKRRPG